MERLARREQSLKAKCDLQEGRLSSNSESRSSAARAQGQSNAVLRGRLAGSNGASSGSAAAKALELRRLVQKKERLKYAVDRLELQSTQRERQLRKSMVAQ